MKKFQFNLLKLAHKFKDKYAQSQTLQQIIEAAASYGEKSANGIMKITDPLSIDVTVGTGMLGGYKVDVSPPKVDPSKANVYVRLPEQIKNYLEKHISNFPQVPMGTTTLTFNSGNQGAEVAQN